MSKLELGAKDYRVEFDDSQLELRGYKMSRHEGVKIISSGFNKSGSDDLGRSLPGRLDYAAEFATTNIYFGTTVIDGEEEAELGGLVRLENHSYIKIDKIFQCDPNRGEVKVVQIGVDDTGLPFSPEPGKNLQTKDLISTTKKGFSRTVTDDFERGDNFNIKVLDKKVDKKLKNNYHIKFNQGYLMRVASYYPSGSSAGYDDGVRLVSHDGNGDPLKRLNLTPIGRNFYYANGGGSTKIGTNNFKLNDPLPVELSHYTGSLTFDNASVPSISLSASSQTTNLRTFYQQFLNPQTFDGSIRSFVTFESGGLGKTTTVNQTSFESLGTVELRGLSTAQSRIIQDEYGNHVYQAVSTKGKDFKVETTRVSGSSLGFNYFSGGAQSVSLNVSASYFYPHTSYQLSVLREDIVLIADLDKETELPDGVGDSGFVLIPPNLHKNIKSNLEYFMMRCGLIPFNKFIEMPDFLNADQDKITTKR